jgi:histidinol-phosphatase (PHP family)
MKIGKDDFHDGNAEALISLHGGHSADFCQHAGDPLEDIVAAYITQGFGIVGITEHMPPASDEYRYPDEVAGGLSASSMQERFERYFDTARRLQRDYADDIQIMVGFETEWYPGAAEYVAELQSIYKPDYIIGSIHHVDGICFDFNLDCYVDATTKAGSLDQLYLRYFEQQLDMIKTLQPPIVGHFDLIRIFDPDYKARLESPTIRRAIETNLQYIADHRLLLDLNMRAIMKGADEPYPARPIIGRARELGISMVPGDDSHDVNSVGFKTAQAVHTLENLGFNTDWNTIIKQLQQWQAKL